MSCCDEHALLLYPRMPHGPSCASRHEITAGYNPLPVTTFLLHGARRVSKTILIECAAVAFGYVLDSTRNGGLTPETCTRQEASPCFTIDRLRPLDGLHVTSTSNYAVSMASCYPRPEYSSASNNRLIWSLILTVTRVLRSGPEGEERAFGNDVKGEQC